MDKYDINKMTLWRQFQKVRVILAGIEASAYLKLYDEFEQCGIIS